MPPPDQREARRFAYYIALAQVGFEMVVPVGIGAALDHYFGWSPWGIIVGAVLGFVTGLVHLISLANRLSESETTRDRREGT